MNIITIKKVSDLMVGDFVVTIDNNNHGKVTISQINEITINNEPIDHEKMSAFVVMAIARTYDSTVDRVFKEFFSNCEIVDEEGNIFPIEGNILCGKMKGIVNY